MRQHHTNAYAHTPLLLLPTQGVRLEELQVLRVLHGFFPTYRDSPLTPQFDRVLQASTNPRCPPPPRATRRRTSR